MLSTKKLSPIITSAILATTIGCGSSSSSQDTGLLTVNVTDAPLTGVTEVVVTFTGVELNPQSGDRIVIEYDEPRTIDLFALQNGDTAPLLQNEELPAGEYNWIRLQVDADRGEMDSYISFEGGDSYSLYVPSGSQTGLQLNRGFTIAAGRSANFTLDFDLRKSVHMPGNNSDDYFLRPTIRMLDNTEVGTISGTIAPSVVSDVSCESGMAVYAYDGLDTAADDEGSATSPVVSAMPEYDADNDIYNFTFAFMLAGDYTLAVTCDADNDDPETDESADDWSAIASQNATVVVDQQTDVAFE